MFEQGPFNVGRSPTLSTIAFLQEDNVKTFPWNSRTKTRHEVGNKAPTCPAWLSVRQKLRTRDSMAKPRDSKSLHARPVPHGEYHRSLSSSTFEMFQWSKVVS